MEYDIPYPTYIPYIGPNNAPLGVKCQGRVVTCFTSSNCLGVPRPEGEIVLFTDASDVGGGGTIYQWQELNPAELTHCHYGTSGQNRDGSLRHDYPTSEWRLVPLGHWNWKWNQARSNYSTYDQELLAGMLVLSSQFRLLGSNRIVWLCDQEPVKSFQKGPPPEKAKLKRWWTYLSQFRLTVHHIPGIKNELSDYISRNNFDALIGESSEALAREAFQRMDVQLDLSMHTAGILEGWSLTNYQSEYEPSALVSNPVSLTGTSGIKTISTSSTRTKLWCLRHDWMGAYSGPISVLVTLALIAQCTSSVSVSTLV